MKKDKKKKQRASYSQQSLVSIADILNNSAPTEDYAIKILTDIRAALKVGHKPMLSDLPELARSIRIGYDRYEKLRTLNALQFSQLWETSLTGRKKFDQLVDEMDLSEKHKR